MRSAEGLMRIIMRLTFVFILTLTFISKAFPSGSIEDLLRKHIIKSHGCDDVRIENLRYPPFSAEPFDITIEENSHGITFFKIRLNDGSTVKASARITPLARVIVSSRALRKGTVIKEEDISARLIDVKKIPSDAFRNPEELRGRLLNRTISGGVIITEAMLAKSITVKKGKRILIVAESPAFRISVPGELIENAYTGGTARAINLYTRKTVSGTLIDEDTLRVEF